MNPNPRSMNPWLRASVLGRCAICAALALGAAAGRADDEKTPQPAKADPPPQAEKADSKEAADKAAPAAKEEKEEKADKSESADKKEEKADKEEKAEKAEKKELTPAQTFEGGEKPLGNWIEFSSGGYLTRGNRGQSQEQHHLQDGPFGGIEDVHYQVSPAKDTTLTLDGRALFNERDYRFSADLRNEKTGYVRMSYRQFRTWYDGDGGSYGQNDAWFPLGDDSLGVDRSELIVEGGLTKEKLPKVTYRYTHRTRDGQKGSTIWGFTHPDFGATKGLSPTVYDINEQSDTFELDVTKRIKKTDVGAGIRYDTAKTDNSRSITQWPGEATQVKVTDRDGSTSDLFRFHTFTETWIKKDLFLSTGFLVSTLDTDYSGSRIYGSDFGVSYAPSLANGLGYYGMDGGGEKKECLFNINLLATPIKSLSIVPSVRVRREVWESESTGLRTQGVGAASLRSSLADGGLLDVTERIDLTYTGVTNVVLYARGEWIEGDGNVNETGGIEVASPIQRRTENERWFQKYAMGSRWYPKRGLSLDLGTYYKSNEYTYDHSERDSTINTSLNRYPGYLVMTQTDTWDAYLRVTFRPLPNVTLMSRYECQLSSVDSATDPVSNLGEVETSTLTSHILSQNVGWSPWSRLYLQAGIDGVFSETKSPASDYAAAVLQAQNNYWTINFNSSFVVDDKTDLNVGYFYYLANNHDEGSAVAVPYGAGAEEHGVTARLTRRLSESLRLTMKYGYFHYQDRFSGGHRDSEAHLVSSGLQYRF